MAMKKKTKEKTDRLFELFCGEAISVMVNESSEQVIQTDTKIETLKSPIVLAGYLVDADENFLYLGYDPEVVSQAINRNTIVNVEIMDNPLNELLEGMSQPKNDEGFN